MKVFAFSLFASSLLLQWTHCVQAGPSLDLNDMESLKSATQASIKNLLAMYDYSDDGGFDQVSMPWWASALVWDMILDYTKWSSGDVQFNAFAAGGLANMSFNSVQDVLNGTGSDLSGPLGRYNDDIGWVALAIQNGAGIYGENAVMPGTGGGEWGVVPTRTAAQMYAQSDDKCGGGIYWQRDRYGSRKTYKSTITNSEFSSLAARVYTTDGNQTMLNQAQEIWSYIIDTNLLTENGTVLDGRETTACDDPETDPWSYQSGQAIQAAVWLSEATGDSSYLVTAGALLAGGQATFANNGNVVAELCEPECTRDSKNFKAVFLRSLPYLYRTTSNDTDKGIIKDLISSSVSAMVSTSCDDSWSCGGNWTTGNTFEYVDIADQHTSSALLVAAMGVYNTETQGIQPTLGGLNAASAVKIGRT